MRDPKGPKGRQATPDTKPDVEPAPSPLQDWESVALSRIAGRVDALTLAADTSATARLRAFGWEAVALAHLRRRLADPGDR